MDQIESKIRWDLGCLILADGFSFARLATYLQDGVRIVEANPAAAELYGYDSPEEMEVGSAVAQSMALVEGVEKLRIEGSDMILTRDPDMPWHLIIAEVTAALKEFFL